MTYPCTEIRNGRLITPGVDFGGPLTIKHKAGRFLVTHTPGHVAWAGVGRRRYYPAVLRLIRLNHRPKQTMKILEETEPGPGGAKLKLRLVIYKADLLDKEDKRQEAERE